jgi:hypothetical protein
MEECLAYFRRAIEHPGTVPPWAEWWATHEELVRRVFPRPEYLRLKYRKLAGARILVERQGWRPSSESQRDPDRAEFCEVCGERLFRMFPDTPREEVIAFGKQAGLDPCRQGFFLHFGLYCPNRCTATLLEFRE